MRVVENVSNLEAIALEWDAELKAIKTEIGSNLPSAEQSRRKAFLSEKIVEAHYRISRILEGSHGEGYR